MSGQCHTKIESVGIYLPHRVVPSWQTVERCVTGVSFPIEALTGIRSTRVAEEDEYSIHLAIKAIEDCLAHSRCQPRDIELLVCANISRCDGPDFNFTFEPATAIKLREHFGFERAVAFDISNACPGLFTAIHLVDAYIKAGTIRRAMVVSGEHITHLTKTAQREVAHLRDPRLACLTLGDAGAAVLLEATEDPSVGFHAIEMYTASRYSTLCIAKPTDREHGGAIMLTEPTKLTPPAVKHATAHAIDVLQRQGWNIDTIDHLIPHQTSRKTLEDMSVVVDEYFHRDGVALNKTIDNLPERGNTATTSHFVALVDHIQNGRIQSGDKIVFSMGGSGLTVGTALLTLDDLPDRLRREETDVRPAFRVSSGFRVKPVARAALPRIEVRRCGIAWPEAAERPDTVALAQRAGRDCLARAQLPASDIDLLLFCGVYRSEFIFEPAIACLIASQLELNSDAGPADAKRTLAFDIFNGGMGLLNACQTAIQMIRAKDFQAALVVSAEVECNGPACPEQPRGVAETGGALLLQCSTCQDRGFGELVFKYDTKYLAEFQSRAAQQQGVTYLRVEDSGQLEQRYLETIPAAVDELLQREGLDISQIRWILPPQRSSQFISALSDRLNVDRERFVDVTRPNQELLTGSLPHALARLTQSEDLEGQVALIIEVGAGVQVGCTVYYG